MVNDPLYADGDGWLKLGFVDEARGGLAEEESMRIETEVRQGLWVGQIQPW